MISAAATQRPIEEIAADFDRDGYVLLPGLIGPDELEALRADTGDIVSGGWEGKEPASDYMHDVLKDTGEDVFHRVQYVFPKAPGGSLLVLLGHPFILQLAHHLLGDDFMCAAEALVFKMARNGREVPVHADCEPGDPRLSPLIFNVDYYLDDATLENGCLWAAPGTHKLNLPQQKIAAAGFDHPGLAPVPVKAGDVLLHNVRLVHGSHRSRGGALRRTLYYEFQSMGAMKAQNGPRPDFPMTDDFVRDRFRLLMRAIDARKNPVRAARDALPVPPACRLRRHRLARTRRAREPAPRPRLQQVHLAGPRSGQPSRAMSRKRDAGTSRARAPDRVC